MDYCTYVISGIWDCMGMELGNKNKILRGVDYGELDRLGTSSTDHELNCTKHAFL